MDGSEAPGTPDVPLEVAVIGAGFSGVCMGIKLCETGITSFAIFEKSDGISGTWHDHTYPGLVCDVPSHLYSYSFELNPSWSRVFSPQEEIKAYVECCVDKYGLRPHIHLGSEVVSARFDEDASLWRICTVDGREVAARVLVSGIGGLSRPKIPDFPGLDEFRGTVFHTARWRKDHDLAGRRVAIIGSAASAIQILPQIARVTEQVFLLQRTPNYIVPRPDRAYSDAQKRRWQRAPWRLRLQRWLIFSLLEIGFLGFRERSWMGRWRTKFAVNHMRRQVPDPELQAKLVPDYPLGCKRVLLSSDFYPSLARDDVELVTSGIERISELGIVTRDGRMLEVDTIILATGYYTTEPLGPLRVEGPRGIELRQAWKDGMKAHRGVAVAGFPNFFMLLGPNSGLGHNSIIFMIEQQVNYVVKCVKRLAPGESMNVHDEAMSRYNEAIQSSFAGTVWAGDCHSWYKDAQGRIPTLWPHSNTRYWRMMRRPDFSEYRFSS